MAARGGHKSALYLICLWNIYDEMSENSMDILEYFTNVGEINIKECREKGIFAICHIG